MSKKIIFAHGWSLSEHLWDHVLSRLGPMGYTTLLLDPMIAEEQNLPAETLDNAIVIGHSLGALWLLSKASQSSYRAFISISGFDCFYKHVNPRDIKTMLLMLERNPKKQIHDFQSYAGLTSDYTNAPTPALPALRTGLQWLAIKDFGIEKQKLHCPILCLASKDDRIVPKKMTLSCWQTQPIKWIETGGHILPLTQPNWCADRILEFIQSLT